MTRGGVSVSIVNEEIVNEEIVLGLESAGLFMTPEEFDAIQEYDENYRYELINGVLVVSPIPLPEETSPNDLLGYLLLDYKERHPAGKVLDCTMPQQYVRTKAGRRIADRLLWVGLGRLPKPRRDPASVAVEFVSAGKRNQRRDYEDKRGEYMEAGIAEYWIVDRFRRTMTVIYNLPSGEEEKIIHEAEVYQSPLLPGFELPLARLLAAADQRAEQD
jgi:Uma2 family endonuclease